MSCGVDKNYSGSWASTAPQGGTDAFGTPPGRTLTDRFVEPLKPFDDGDRHRALFSAPTPDLHVQEARTPVQIAMFIVIVVGVISAMIFA